MVAAAVAVGLLGQPYDSRSRHRLAPMGMGMSPEAEAAKKREFDLNRRCQEAIEPILRNSGYHVRIVFYPGRGDKSYRQPLWRWLWRIILRR